MMTKTREAKKEAGKNLMVVVIVGVFMILALLSFVSAYQRLCLTYGQSIPSNENPIYSCDHDSCQICVNDALYPTAPYRCNDVKGCDLLGNSTIDKEPPVLNVNSPVNDLFYNSASVLFDLSANELVSFYYIDNINGRGKWSRIASNVNNFNKAIRVKEGLNDLTIKAVDRNGNFAEIIKKFRVDSKKPKITKTLPSKGFADGNFEVEFKEENPKSLVLYYGNLKTGERNAAVNLNECDGEKGKFTCAIEVSLGDYNEQEIEYYFEIIDIADASYKSKPVKLNVDTKKPVINNPGLFWEQGQGKNSKYVYFSINITEPNFEEVSYFYLDTKGTMKEKKLCSSLKNGICSAKKTFKSGEQLLNIQVTDEAGNYAIGEIGLEIVY